MSNKSTMKSSPKIIEWMEEMRVNFDVFCNCLRDVCCLHIHVCSDLFVSQTDAFSPWCEWCFK